MHGFEVCRQESCNCGCNDEWRQRTIDLMKEIEEYQTIPIEQIALEMSKQRKIKEIEVKFHASTTNTHYFFPRKLGRGESENNMESDSEQSSVNNDDLAECTFYNLNTQHSELFNRGRVVGASRIAKKSQPHTKTIQQKAFGKIKRSEEKDQRYAANFASVAEVPNFKAGQSEKDKSMLAQESARGIQLSHENGRGYYNVPVAILQQNQQQQQPQHRKYQVKNVQNGEQSGSLVARVEEIQTNQAEKERMKGIIDKSPQYLMAENKYNQRSVTEHGSSSLSGNPQSMIAKSENDQQQKSRKTGYFRRLRPVQLSENFDINLENIPVIKLNSMPRGKEKELQIQQSGRLPSSTKAEATQKLISSYSFFPSTTKPSLKDASKNNAFTLSKHHKVDQIVRGLSGDGGGGDGGSAYSSNVASTITGSDNSSSIVIPTSSGRFQMPQKRRTRLSKKSLGGGLFSASTILEDQTFNQGNSNQSKVAADQSIQSPQSKFAKKRVVLAASQQTKLLRGNWDSAYFQPNQIATKDLFDFTDSQRPVKTDGNYDDRSRGTPSYKADVTITSAMRRLPESTNSAQTTAAFKKNKSISTHNPLKTQEIQSKQSTAIIPFSNISGYSTISRGSSKPRHPRQLLSQTSGASSVQQQPATSKSKSEENKVNVKLTASELDQPAMNSLANQPPQQQPAIQSGRIRPDSQRNLVDSKTTLPAQSQREKQQQSASEDNPALPSHIRLQSLHTNHRLPPKTTTITQLQQNYVSNIETSLSTGASNMDNVKEISSKKSYNGFEGKIDQPIEEDGRRQMKRNSEYLNTLLQPHSSKYQHTEAGLSQQQQENNKDDGGMMMKNVGRPIKVSIQQQQQQTNQSSFVKSTKVRIILPTAVAATEKDESVMNSSILTSNNLPRDRSFHHYPAASHIGRMPTQHPRTKKLIIHSGVTLSLNASSSSSSHQQPQQPSQIHLNMYTYQ